MFCSLVGLQNFGKIKKFIYFLQPLNSKYLLRKCFFYFFNDAEL